MNSVEIILANGEVTRVSQTDEKKDLFNGAAGAFGTLGVLTLLEIQLIPAKTYVALTYIPVVDTKDAIATLRECVIAEKQPFDFVDGIQFSKDLGVICVGHMTDTCTNTPQTFSGPWDPWFYMHAQSRCSSGSKEIPLTDTIPLQDYLFRYDRGAFWMGKYYPLFPFSFLNNTFSRWFWDSFLHTRVLFQSMHISNRSQKFIIQDLGLPMHKAEEFLDFVDEELGIYPLWLCPLTIGREVNFQRVGREEEGRKWSLQLMLEYGVLARRTSGSLSLRTGGWSGGWVSLAGENDCMLILIIRKRSFGSCMTGNSMRGLGRSIVQRVCRMCTRR